MTQVPVLVDRHIALLRTQEHLLRNNAVLLAVVGTVLLLLVGSGSLDPGHASHSGSRSLLFGLVFFGFVAGTINSAQEISREESIYQRERAWGLSVGSYVVAKLAVIGLLSAVQAAALVGVATITSGGERLAIASLALDVAVVAVAATAAGLFLSGLGGKFDGSPVAVVVTLLLGFLLSGFVPGAHGGRPLQVLGYTTNTNWGLAAAASSSDLYRLEGRCLGEAAALSPSPERCDARWRYGAGQWRTDVGATVAHGAALALATVFWLHHKEHRSGPRRHRRG